MHRTTPHPPSPSAAPRRVLVVEDDPTVAEVVTGYLSRAGYATDHAADGFAALDRAASFRPHLIVLDLMLPGLDGLEVCRRLRRREEGPSVPVVMLTARGEEADRIAGLELGADDYVTKPFSPRELVLRIGSVLRRAEAAPPAAAPAQILRVGDLSADPGGRRAIRAGRELTLTSREFDLLLHFMRHPGRVFSREELLQQVWGWEIGDLSTVTVHVRRLREKIEADPAAPRLVMTVWGAGYRFDPVADEPQPEDGPPAGGGPLAGGGLRP
ncbi:response regulator transcription factor [Streptomyces tubercidicus]|uniref:response regulator transcription factor n=1 Tax=Streptomyces tubercidicus TaxID=47759 RepID=UPI00135A91D3|nr:response regulator transcription factor [Streptomyces tubercidicus]WAU15057.1 response regulator transcription factor [Streptomyces tubercidicus]